MTVGKVPSVISNQYSLIGIQQVSQQTTETRACSIEKGALLRLIDL
jgi:hypothetical protein